MRGSGALLYELAAAHSRCAVGVLVRVLNAPLPPESFRTCFVCATHAHSARSIGFCAIWVCISSSSRVLLVVPVPVLVLVLVALLAPLVCDSTNRAENTSLPIYGCVQKYTPDTNERTIHERNNN